MTANNIGSSTVESSTSEMPRKPMTKASEHRRITKPIMEKKRRARINNSLNELKGLILDALNKDPSRHSKLEKADILEMTVRHLQKLQRQQVTANIVNDTSVLNKYRAGYSECATEVSRFMGNMEGVDQSLRQRILSHLNHCVNSLGQMATNAQFALNAKTAFPGMAPPPSNNSQLHVQIPISSTTNMFSGSSHMNGASNDINNNSFINPNMYSSPVDLKSSLTTPPSSASSTSSHFAFNLSLHSPKVPLSLTAGDIFYRKQLSSLSPGSSSYTSGQLSPMGSEDLEMAVDCTTTNRKVQDDENVWRPW
ncbi:hypothetical protein RDWZM_005933 [Blomia tropicalis]|uniref:Uncharacterized protein n=1 Tax=Blomia tropicalis TaxID=40697 RepID=A0A9Q0RNW3_BLOTA|nr:hypothetical protein RDWZM_005933 [Blomia tropicalis]